MSFCHAAVEKLKEWLNVVSREIYFNVGRNVKKSWIAKSINAKGTVTMDNAFLVKKNIWLTAFVAKIAMLWTALKNHTPVILFAKKY